MAIRFSIDEISKSNRHTLGRDIDVAVFRLIRFMDLEKYLGRGAHGVIYECGRELGQSLNPKSIDDIIKFCEEYKIGKIEVVNKNPIQIRVYECISCSGLPEVGETLCWFEGGFIAGCLEKILNKKVRAKETHCAGLGDDFCQFEITTL
ncbi:V4R domain-containing protein [Methanocaldococcus sp.]